MNVLAGYTGFVGSNLLDLMPFDLLLNSKNSEQIRGTNVENLVWSGVRAEKWKANQEPENDRTHIESVANLITSVKAKNALLISTVDVYTKTNEGDEDSIIDKNPQAYGRNRLWLEQVFLNHFKNGQVVRLPGLFGDGLKKNVIFDLMNNKSIDQVDTRAKFQFYFLDWLVKDLKKIILNGYSLTNITSAPLTLAEITQEIFDLQLEQLFERPVPDYNIKSRYDTLWQGQDGYMYSKEKIIEALKIYVNRTRNRESK